MKTVSLDFPEVNYTKWKEVATKSLKGKDFAELYSNNVESITLEPYYNHENRKKLLTQFENANTQIISCYFPEFENDINGFVIDCNTTINSVNKHIFHQPKNSNELKNITIESNNIHYILYDIFSELEKNGSSVENYEALKTEILSKNAKSKICVDISLHQNSGANIVEQVAFALLKIENLISLFGNEIINTVVIKTAIGSNFLMEIAKLKTLRILFEKLSEKYQAKVQPIIFAETSLRNKSTLDVENNLIRSTLESISAIIGSANFLQIHSYKSWNNPKKEDLEIAYKQFLLLSHESLLNFYDDASLGSYSIDTLTNEIMENSWNLFEELQQKGTYETLLKIGTIKEMIDASHQKEQELFDSEKINLIGVNKSPSKVKNMETNEVENINISPKRLSKKIELNC